MKRFFIAFGKGIAAVILLAVTVIAVFSVSPVYDFSAPRPFSGPDIFNPYAALGQRMCDGAIQDGGCGHSCGPSCDPSCDPSCGPSCGKTWKRANFHTHTRVRPFLSECDLWPREVLPYYDSLGYDIVTFSNHNALTVHPCDTALQVNVYEHGYNLFKYHLLVFGSDRVNRFDPLLPVLVSQRQWKLDMLGRDSDFIQLNHPFRTWLTSRDGMECLTGYEIMELDSGVTTEQEYWDWALSAGHYSFALANDDLHHPERSWCIGIRSNMLYCRDGSYASLKETLLGGCYYCMRMPDFGAEGPDVGTGDGGFGAGDPDYGAEDVAGDTAEVPGRGTLSGDGGWVQRKRAGIAAAPRLTGIGVEGDTLHLELSDTASLIKAVGQGGRVLASAENATRLCYVMAASDSYVRFTACFDDGTVIYTNPFARYDKALAGTGSDRSEDSTPSDGAALPGGSPLPDGSTLSDDAALPTGYFETPYSVNWPLTILWNLLVLALASLSIWGIIRLYHHSRGEAEH